MSAIVERFSPDYAAARDRFRAATKRFEGGAFEVAPGLTIDWAWSGPENAPAVLLYTSGLHGVEGFGGGAAQLEALSLADTSTAVLWVHALNPFGWANLRRVNEANVDLNRNFNPEGGFSGADPAYAALDGLLNPQSPPGGFDPFWLKAGWAVATQGFGALKNAVVSGQYVFPKGLFYGGAALQPGPAWVLPFLLERLRGRERVVHVDWHSALGRYGGRTLLLEGAVEAREIQRVKAAFGEDVRAWDPADPQGYLIRGGLTGALLQGLPGVRYDGLTIEFGTLSNLAVLARLRAENRLHHWGQPALNHPAKAGMREAFAPLDPAWQERVLLHAREVHAGCLRCLAS
ncbi:deacylase [Deltaproteobacteria bacterium]|nr:deacylase [Deltaproteobacteria bacterium]